MLKVSRCAGVGLALAAAIGLGRAGVAADLQSDDFSGSSLGSVWNVQNPNSADWAVEDGKLRITAEHNSNVWADDTATRFSQTTSQDFDVESNALVHYLDTSTVTGITAFSGTTLDITGRDGEWVTLKLWGRGGADNNAVLQYQRRENDDGAFGYVGTQPDYMPDQGDIAISFRVRKVGDEYTSWFKPDGVGDWIEVSTVTSALQTPLEVGIYAGLADADGGEMTVWFDDFVEASSPIGGTTAVDPHGKTATTWSTLKR